MNGTWYDVVVFLHVSAVILLFMGSALLHAAATVMAKTKNLDVFGSWLGIMRRFSPLTGIAALVVFVLGFVLLGMNQDKEAFSYSTPWVIVAIVVFFVLEGLSGMLLAPYGRDIRDGFEAAQKAGSTDVTSEVRATVLDRKAWAVMFAMTWGFIGIVFLMLVKPDGWLWSVVTAVVAVGIGLIEGHLVHRSVSK